MSADRETRSAAGRAAESDRPWAVTPHNWVGRESLLAALKLGASVDHSWDAARARSEQRVSLRALHESLKLPVSFSTAWRAHAIHKLFVQYPEVASCTHLGVGHLGALLGAPEAVRLSVLRRAERERWSRRKLVREVAAMRRRLPAEPPPQEEQA